MDHKKSLDATFLLKMKYLRWKRNTNDKPVTVKI